MSRLQTGECLKDTSFADLDFSALLVDSLTRPACCSIILLLLFFLICCKAHCKGKESGNCWAQVNKLMLHIQFIFSNFYVRWCTLSHEVVLILADGETKIPANLAEMFDQSVRVLDRMDCNWFVKRMYLNNCLSFCFCSLPGQVEKFPIRPWEEVKIFYCCSKGMFKQGWKKYSKECVCLESTLQWPRF